MLNMKAVTGTVVLDGGLSTALEEQGATLEGALWTARLLAEAPSVSPRRTARTSGWGYGRDVGQLPGQRRGPGRRWVRRGGGAAPDHAQRDARAGGPRRVRGHRRGLLVAASVGPTAPSWPTDRSTPGGMASPRRGCVTPTRLAELLAAARPRPARGRDHPRRRRGRGSGLVAGRPRRARLVQLPARRRDQRRPAIGRGLRRSHRQPVAHRCGRQLLRPDRCAGCRPRGSGCNGASCRGLPQSGRQLGQRPQDVGVRRSNRSRSRRDLVGAGARFIGGCCGTGPADVAALVERLEGLERLERAERSEPRNG